MANAVLHTPPKYSMSPENEPFQKEHILLIYNYGSGTSPLNEKETIILDYWRDPIFQVQDYGRKGIPTRIFQEVLLVLGRVSCDPAGASAEWISVMGLVELDFV